MLWEWKYLLGCSPRKPRDEQKVGDKSLLAVFSSNQTSLIQVTRVDYPSPRS